MGKNDRARQRERSQTKERPQAEESKERQPLIPLPHFLSLSIIFHRKILKSEFHFLRANVARESNAIRQAIPLLPVPFSKKRTNNC